LGFFHRLQNAVTQECFDADPLPATERWRGRGWRLWGRDRADYAGRYPELDMLRGLPVGTLVDGELVAFGAHGRPELRRLLRRHGLTDPWRIRQARRWPADATLSAADREFALQVALTHTLAEDGSELDHAAWEIVKTRDAGKEAYALALRQAEAGVRLVPGNGYILNTLGVAQYRTRRYAEALATLMQSEKLNATRDGSHPGDLAFLAMAQHQLGKKDDAKATLGRLRDVKMQLRWANNAEAKDFLREAEELIEGKPADYRK
jgi:hypothetical protein